MGREWKREPLGGVSVLLVWFLHPDRTCSHTSISTCQALFLPGRRWSWLGNRSEPTQESRCQWEPPCEDVLVATCKLLQILKHHLKNPNDCRVVNAISPVMILRPVHKVKLLTQGHTANEQQSPNLTLGLFSSKANI